jgi:xylan 1,4-beta-xylosidase
MRTNPENAYRNGTMYSSYTAAQIARTFELADQHKVNLLGSVTWAFEFENQPFFAGFRDLATNGIDKPVLNVFRMLGKMHGDRVAVTSTSAAGVETIREEGVRSRSDVYALASRSDKSMEVLVWNYHDDDLPAAPAEIAMTVEGLAAGNPTVIQYRVDDRHSNSYEVWKQMGSPQSPTAAQRATLEKAGQLQTVSSPVRQRVVEGRLTINLSLPRQGSPFSRSHIDCFPAARTDPDPGQSGSRIPKTDPDPEPRTAHLDHSSLSAMIGSVRPARSAGQTHA